MIYLGIGGNLPFNGQNTINTQRAAIDALRDAGVRVEKMSPFYASAPVPVSDQPWFINAVLGVETDLSPHVLMQLLLSIEEKFGRMRSVKNAARTLDLDLVDYHGKIFCDALLELPHPRLAERAFVLKPLYDIAQDWRHPITGLSIAQLMEALPLSVRASILPA